MHSLLFNTDVSESSSFIRLSLIMAHGLWANVMTPGGEKEQKCSGMRSGLEDIMERMTKKGKMRLGRGMQERLRVQKQQPARGQRRKGRGELVPSNGPELFVNAVAPRQRLVWG